MFPHFRYYVLLLCFFALCLTAAFSRTATRSNARSHFSEDVWDWAEREGADSSVTQIFDIFAQFDKIINPVPGQAQQTESSEPNTQRSSEKSDLSQEQLAKLAEQKLRELKRQFEDLKAEYDTIFATIPDEAPLWKRALRLFSPAVGFVDTVVGRVQNKLAPEVRQLFQAMHSFIHNFGTNDLTKYGRRRYPRLYRAYRDMQSRFPGLDLTPFFDRSKRHVTAFLRREIDQMQKMWRYIDSRLEVNQMWARNTQYMKRSIGRFRTVILNTNWQKELESFMSSPRVRTFMRSSFAKRVRQLFKERNMGKFLSTAASQICRHFETNIIALWNFKTNVYNRVNRVLSTLVKELFSYDDLASFRADITSSISSHLKSKRLRVIAFRRSIETYARDAQSQARTFRTAMNSKLNGSVRDLHRSLDKLRKYVFPFLVQARNRLRTVLDSPITDNIKRAFKAGLFPVVYPLLKHVLYARDSVAELSGRVLEFTSLEIMNAYQHIATLCSTFYSTWIFLDKFFKGMFILLFVLMLWYVAQILGNSIVMRAAFTLLASIFDTCSEMLKKKASSRQRTSITQTSGSASTSPEFGSDKESETSMLKLTNRDVLRSPPAEYVTMAKSRSKRRGLPARIPILYEETSSTLTDQERPRRRRTSNTTPRRKSGQSGISSEESTREEQLKRVEVRMVYANAEAGGEGETDREPRAFRRRKSGSNKHVRRRLRRTTDADVIVIDD